jgi:hypothetical protein
VAVGGGSPSSGCADPFDSACLGDQTSPALNCSGRGSVVCSPLCACQCNPGWRTSIAASPPSSFCSEAMPAADLTSRTAAAAANSSNRDMLGCTPSSSDLLCLIANQVEYVIAFIAACLCLCLCLACLCCGPRRVKACLCGDEDGRRGCLCRLCCCSSSPGRESSRRARSKRRRDKPRRRNSRNRRQKRRSWYRRSDAASSASESTSTSDGTLSDSSQDSASSYESRDHKRSAHRNRSARDRRRHDAMHSRTNPLAVAHTSPVRSPLHAHMVPQALSELTREELRVLQLLAVRLQARPRENHESPVLHSSTGAARLRPLHSAATNMILRASGCADLDAATCGAIQDATAEGSGPITPAALARLVRDRSLAPVKR